ncbi:helix-turn-helix domain-containing protein [Pseudorhodoferax sp. LjRoot39]|uniref:helix-turn-helix domain-containing protein n=1 Tax=Pseudorhodoferax sp. LjRoot39 TaxID=3342328 RepID=UPI003ED0F544
MLARFDDFHLYGASAPEWHQRYQQVSRGSMRSSMLEATLGRTHLFRKSLSQRVLQQGCLPAGKICFALATPAAGVARMQGREVRAQSLFILRGGEEFVIHRPPGMELLAVTFDASSFAELLAQQNDATRLGATLGRGLVELPPSVLAELRRALSASFMADATGSVLPWVEAAVPAAVVHALRGGQRGAGRDRGMSSHALVSECHRITLASAHAPPTVAALCTRLRVSRRTLQDSFRKVAETTPVDYLRAMRLNLVRQALHRTLPGAVDIGEVATHAGFSQLSHFARQYQRLFGELPSQTLRADRLGQSARAVPAV